MNAAPSMIPADASDSDLVHACLGGDRGAFGQIVDRHKTFVASVAYSSTGSLAESEDIAQETFIAAWSRLGSLREPTKLRPWLAGIARNRLHKRWASRRREPSASGIGLEEAPALAGSESMPSEEAVNREEEAILWKALERIPELYREPLILFYREHLPVAEMAAALELTEDAAKQRLSRGRKLLEEEVQHFVEGALRRSVPGRAFSGLVLAGLPVGVLPGAVGGVSVGAKASAAAKATPLLAWLAPILGVLAVFYAQLVIGFQEARSPKARSRMLGGAVLIWSIVLAVCVGGEWLVQKASERGQWSDATHFVAMVLFWTVVPMGLVTLNVYTNCGEDSGPDSPAPGTVEPPMSTLTLAIACFGFAFGVFSWLARVAWQSGDSVGAAGVGVIALVGGLASFLSVRGESLRVVKRRLSPWMGGSVVMIVLVLNLRLDVWMADNLHHSVATIHELYPFWVVAAGSLALLGYSAAFITWFIRRKKARCGLARF